ncbi:VanZ family protein [Psychrobacillus sp. FSL W7-1493]|uniref:VanZ family protein n=1 Tax=unclassified Psychrobacillus TaxID=2636677 RepID=UPI0030F65C67
MNTAKNTLVCISLILYLFALVFILFFDSRGYRLSEVSFGEYINWSSNFIPFRTINLYIHSIAHGTLNIKIPLKNLGGNLILFLPMGIFLPLIIKRINNIRIYVITMTVLLLFIEVTQVVSRRGSFDIDDLILNMLGAVIGFAIWNDRFVKKY